MKRATQSHWLRPAYMSKTALIIPSGCFWASVQQRWHHCSTLRFLLCRPFFITSQSFDWVAFFTICANYLHVVEEHTKFFILHFYTPYFHTHESRGGQTAYDKCPKRVLCNRTHTHLRSDNLVQRVPSRFGHSHSVFYVTKGMEHLCPPEMPFSYSQQITSIPHVPNVRVHFLAVSRSRSKTSVLSGRNRHLWPHEARGQMLPEILGSVQCVISGQIIEIAIENPTIKDRKETSCWISAYRRLQSGWNAPCGSVSFPRAPGNVLHMTGNFFSFKRRNLVFLFSRKWKKIIYILCQKICCFFGVF